MRVIVRSSPIHAAGVFALERIPKGTRVLEYTGDRLKHKDADKLYDARPYTYLFGVGNGTYVIDGYGTSMYVNHSCDPNCETEEDDDERIWIVTKRAVAAGEELAYDYFLYDGVGPAKCTCGAKKCRGTMYSPAELRARKRKSEERKKKRAAKQRKLARAKKA